MHAKTATGQADERTPRGRLRFEPRARRQPLNEKARGGFSASARRRARTILPRSSIEQAALRM